MAKDNDKRPEFVPAKKDRPEHSEAAVESAKEHGPKHDPKHGPRLKRLRPETETTGCKITGIS